jgi:hypothetical protein
MELNMGNVSEIEAIIKWDALLEEFRWSQCVQSK